MGGGDSYSGFPVANPTVSYWQLPPHRIANLRSTPELPTSDVFDYIIIGSGISGAAVAYKLLSREPTLSILMLEARTAASGASGRNGGHCRGGFWLNFQRYAEAFGEDDALKFERFEEQNIQDIADFVREHNVDCDFRNVQTFDMGSKEASWESLMELVRSREEVRQRRPNEGALTVPELLRGEEARKRTGISRVIGAATYPAHTQNPYRLVCRMLEMSLEKGLNLQTNTPALHVRRSEVANSSAKWEVETERGVVRAKRVVLATNAYTNALHKGLAETGFLRPSRSQVTAIRPGSDITGNPALRNSAAIEDFEKGAYFMCRLPGLEGEGDVIYGGGKSVSKTREDGITDDSEVHSGIAEYLHGFPSQLFGRDTWGKDGDVVRDWTGIVCYTPDTLPLVGETPGEMDLWMTVGMNGHGSKSAP